MQEITNEIAETLESYLELCEQPGVEFSIRAFGQHLIDNYEL